MNAFFIASQHFPQYVDSVENCGKPLRIKLWNAGLCNNCKL